MLNGRERAVVDVVVIVVAMATAVLNQLLPPFLRPQLSSLSSPKKPQSPGGGR